MLLASDLTEAVIGLAIDVHRHTGPGLLESIYEHCLCHEFRRAGLAFERQVGIPIIYKGEQIHEGIRADIVVDGRVILKVKAVATILPVHEAQVLT